MRIIDRPEFAGKPKPLTTTPDATVSSAVAEMARKNYGSVVVVDGDSKVQGIVTERDILRRLVNENRDPGTTKVSEIMTENPRLAKADDEITDWLQIMSNERFRRIPIVDENDRLVSIMTQGDFVSYTWPDLVHQAKELAKATVSSNYQIFLIAGGIAVYTLALALILG